MVGPIELDHFAVNPQQQFVIEVAETEADDLTGSHGRSVPLAEADLLPSAGNSRGSTSSIAHAWRRPWSGRSRQRYLIPASTNCSTNSLQSAEVSTSASNIRSPTQCIPSRARSLSP